MAEEIYLLFYYGEMGQSKRERIAWETSAKRQMT